MTKRWKRRCSKWKTYFHHLNLHRSISKDNFGTHKTFHIYPFCPPGITHKRQILCCIPLKTVSFCHRLHKRADSQTPNLTTLICIQQYECIIPTKIHTPTFMYSYSWLIYVVSHSVVSDGVLCGPRLRLFVVFPDIFLAFPTKVFGSMCI